MPSERKWPNPCALGKPQILNLNPQVLSPRLVGVGRSWVSVGRPESLLTPNGVGIPEGLSFEHTACGLQGLRPFEALNRRSRKFCSY